MKNLKLIAACALLASSSLVFSHGNMDHGAASAAAPTAPASHAAEPLPWGQAGNPAAATRTIELTMDDTMRFTPAHFTVRRGETVRLRVTNVGQAMHEAVLGTAQSLAAHEAMMAQHPGMAHDAPYMAHVAPGQTGELTWTFDRAGEFDFACLVAGHFAAGMKGGFTVTP